MDNNAQALPYESLLSGTAKILNPTKHSSTLH